jgi:protein TonB
MRFDWRQHKDAGFLIASFAFHAALIACFCVYSALHAVSADEGPQIIEVSLVVDNEVPQPAPTTLAASTPEKPPEKKLEKKVARKLPAPLAMKKLSLTKAVEKPAEVQATVQQASLSSAAQAAAGSKEAEEYAATLLAWLNKHKTYPPEARSQNVEGHAVLWLSITADGTIAGSRIEQSTGNEALDEAISQMIRRANPAPAPPAAREFRLPIIFKLKRN